MIDLKVTLKIFKLLNSISAIPIVGTYLISVNDGFGQFG